MTDQVEKVKKEVAGQEASRMPPLDKGKRKVEEVPKKKQHFSATGIGKSSASLSLPHFEVPAGEKLMVAISIATGKGVQKRATEAEHLAIRKRLRP